MAGASNAILDRMLERLFLGLMNGPSVNCRPHNSRQRIDLTQLDKFSDLAPTAVLAALLEPDRKIKLTGQNSPPPAMKFDENTFKRTSTATSDKEDEPDDPKLTPEQRKAIAAWKGQQRVVNKLKIVADEARTYEQDTGANVLQIGFPLVCLPPGSGKQNGTGLSRRVLAPIAFIPISLGVRSSGAKANLEISAARDRSELVVPNRVLLAWLERLTGDSFADLFNDDDGTAPWREIAQLTQIVSKKLNLEFPEFLKPCLESDAPPDLSSWTLAAAPNAEDAKPGIVPAAVLGLFPMNNEGLLRDLQAMAGGESLAGPIESFLKHDTALDGCDPAVVETPSQFHNECLVTMADPSQRQAVRYARHCRGVVVHGPPGTGKSQTITNIIGDSLARGQRVLMVCDKRTALDVVAHRLDHLGLGSLCAVVHDPARDQRELYRSMREHMEGLVDIKVPNKTLQHVQKINDELKLMHDELTSWFGDLMQAGPNNGPSFHELVGQWLAAAPIDAPQIEPTELTGLSVADLEQRERDLCELFDRGCNVKYGENPWSTSAAMTLADFLAQPMDRYRKAMDQMVESSVAADATVVAGLPPFAKEVRPFDQAASRARLADQLDAMSGVPAEVVNHWLAATAEQASLSRQRLAELAAQVEWVRKGALDTELVMIVPAEQLEPRELARQLGELEAYRAVANRWYSLFCFGKRATANKVVASFGLPPGAANIDRVYGYLSGVRARRLLRQWIDQHRDKPLPVVSDADLLTAVGHHQIVLDLLKQLKGDASLGELSPIIAKAFEQRDQLPQLVTSLRTLVRRAEAIEALEQQLKSCGLFTPGSVDSIDTQLRAGKKAGELFRTMRQGLESLEGVLRTRAGLETLPEGLRRSCDTLLKQGTEANVALASLRRAMFAKTISDRMVSQPNLRAIDSQRVEATCERYRTLVQSRAVATRDAVLNYWLSRQKERLLAATGSRLNTAGADLKRRLTLRGERALRLRQVVEVGRTIEGGDPLFDVCPVWLASPETVAQVFPRLPLFDLVVFDEASQCRLEEALPVLTRGQRVVIAGDTKQLPPTRFFESTVAVSEQDEIETDQDLFESQQAETEDLLAAALALEIQECYLDVHYRSSNADLIEFSNEQFYGSRLQAIPGHPANRSRFAPITLYRVDGVNENRANKREADEICRIVGDLLKRAEPPSIGIACFNLTQRDLISERLDAMAEEDTAFAERLDEARKRVGSNSFEGLFVKNLESVQGDERDHIIISTTFGPDANGKFYRRFGPLGTAGGGRRLNVLVTRARDEIHLVTSIPVSVYRALPPVPPGQQPTGAWLLFRYLQFAEQLAGIYEKAHEVLEQAGERGEPIVTKRKTDAPSLFAETLANQISRDQHRGSDVYWGNDGFCVDLALHHPERLDDVTIGVLCDATRFPLAADRVEWELFRTEILRSQGWKLFRLWTPHFFRDPQGALAAMAAAADEFLKSDTDLNAIPVTRSKPPR